MNKFITKKPILIVAWCTDLWNYLVPFFLYFFKDIWRKDTERKHFRKHDSCLENKSSEKKEKTEEEEAKDPAILVSRKMPEDSACHVLEGRERGARDVVCVWVTSQSDDIWSKKHQIWQNIKDWHRDLNNFKKL